MPRAERARRLARRVAAEADDVAETIADARGSLVDRIEPAVERVAAAGGALVDLIEPTVERVAPTVRSVRKRVLGKFPEPLPNLYDVHPKARMASIRELGLYPIPVEEIVGTAVEGPAQRGTDFLPLPPFRSRNWEARWQRVRAAVDRLASLPPIDVLKAGGVYWVRDGHNRVAAARLANQVDIDAVVTAVQLPGERPELPHGPIEPVLAEALELNAVHRPVFRSADTPDPEDPE
jgi:hypothetical protein